MVGDSCVSVRLLCGMTNRQIAGILGASHASALCGRDTVEVSTLLCRCNNDIRATSADNARFVVDAADRDAMPVAAEELHELLKKPTIEGIPLLILGNKSDLPGKMSVDELIEALDLKKVTHREISCYGISAKEETNLDAVLQWLVARSSK